MESRDAELAAAVMDYLVEFPKAMDTLKGIAEWWINRRKVRADVEDLMRVLGRLIDLGFLEQIGTGEGAHYRLRQN
jgi:hypothetical protein